MRRLAARTMAKQVAKIAEEATAPFQCALTTKAGCVCVAHILQTITDLDNRARLGTLSSKLQKNSSKNTFIQEHFHPRHFRPKTGSSNDTFIPKWFRPMTFSSKTGFIQ